MEEEVKGFPIGEPEGCPEDFDPGEEVAEDAEHTGNTGSE